MYYQSSTGRWSDLLSRFAVLFKKTTETAAKQRAVSLFFRSPRAGLLRISAADAVWFADNLREKQRKQR
jgi:hypothetical protein